MIIGPAPPWLGAYSHIKSFVSRSVFSYGGGRGQQISIWTCFYGWKERELISSLSIRVLDTHDASVGGSVVICRARFQQRSGGTSSSRSGGGWPGTKFLTLPKASRVHGSGSSSNWKPNRARQFALLLWRRPLSFWKLETSPSLITALLLFNTSSRLFRQRWTPPTTTPMTQITQS
jgi:hypothetical protein